MAKQAKPQMTPLERAIVLRERGIERMEKRKADIRRRAEEECAVIDKGMAQKRVLLDALKRGSLKP